MTDPIELLREAAREGRYERDRVDPRNAAEWSADVEKAIFQVEALVKTAQNVIDAVEPKWEYSTEGRLLSALAPFAPNEDDGSNEPLEPDDPPHPRVIYRWRALDYSGFCYGSTPPDDLPQEACLTAFYRDPDGLRTALHEISATGNLTATDKQFGRHLQQIARNALAGAAEPDPSPQEPGR